jgi:beta-lactamase class A
MSSTRDRLRPVIGRAMIAGCAMVALATTALVGISPPAAAQPPTATPPSPVAAAPSDTPSSTDAVTAAPSAFDRAADALPAALTGAIPADTVFAPLFLAAVPPAQITALATQLRDQHGALQSIQSRAPTADGQTGRVVIRYDRALVHFALAADPDGRIVGLRIVNIGAIDDSMAALTHDLAALPGQVAWGIYRIDANSDATLLHGANGALSLAVGSSFKLAILGALDEDIRAGRRRWGDVALLNRQTFPGGTLTRWPSDAPMTLHSLATLMISESDNRATDVLLHIIGRTRIEAFARRRGGLSGPNAFPLLSTMEAAVLKNPALGEARTAWLSGDEAGRRAVLARYAARWTPADIAMTAFTSGPADIDRIEWFASPDSIARILGWFARSASPQAQAILAINPGIPSGAASEWDYLGYKGGSEPGVMAMNLLLREGDAVYAASFTWNNSAASVDDTQIVALATRAAALLHAEAHP